MYRLPATQARLQFKPGPSRRFGGDEQLDPKGWSGFDKQRLALKMLSLILFLASLRSRPPKAPEPEKKPFVIPDDRYYSYVDPATLPREERPIWKPLLRATESNGSGAQASAYVTLAAIQRAQNKHKKNLRRLCTSGQQLKVSAHKPMMRASWQGRYKKSKPDKQANARRDPPPEPPLVLGVTLYQKVAREVLEKFKPPRITHSPQVMKTLLPHRQDEPGALITQAVAALCDEVERVASERKRVDRKLLHRFTMKFYGELVGKAWERLKDSTIIDDEHVVKRLRLLPSARRLVHEVRCHLISETYFLIEIDKGRTTIDTAMSPRRFKLWLRGDKRRQTDEDAQGYRPRERS